ncbi:MAG: LPXTG cell wall anchor domain-containing protein [Propionibacteriaceae bacterium]|jgi:LPXTG-motif cell wall-anchored protein|nr:LPXTG cell wall anchor domain-containing protein [Propionibacteriaceae bacterium]
MKHSGGIAFNGIRKSVASAIAVLLGVAFMAPTAANAVQVDYHVNIYCQASDGSYPATVTPIVRQAEENTAISVTEADGQSQCGSAFLLDSTQTNVVSGTATATTTAQLTIYMRRSITVTYSPGSHGDWTVGTSAPYYYTGLAIGDPMPSPPAGTGEVGYYLSSWEPSIPSTVPAGAAYTYDYVAQWEGQRIDYTVEYYYQNADGTWPTAPTDARYDGTDYPGPAQATAADRIPDNTLPDKYAYTGDAWTGPGGLVNIVEAPLDPNHHTELKLYFQRVYTITYQPGSVGTWTAVNGDGVYSYEDVPYGSAMPGPNTANLPHTIGWYFTGWAPNPAATVTQNAEYVAQWSQNIAEYTVEKYYQQGDGNWPTTADEIDWRTAPAYTHVTVLPSDKVPDAAHSNQVYVGDSSTYPVNVLEGDTAITNQLVLKVYFRLEFTVIYRPGDHGNFNQVDFPNLIWHDPTPQAPDNAGCQAGYEFRGWEPAIVDKVEKDAIYTAICEPIEQPTTEGHLKVVHTLVGGTPPATTVTATGPSTFTGTTSFDLTVPTGTYELARTLVPGYAYGTWTCVSGTAASTMPTATSVTVARGESVVCTVTDVFITQTTDDPNQTPTDTPTDTVTDDGDDTDEPADEPTDDETVDDEDDDEDLAYTGSENGAQGAIGLSALLLGGLFVAYRRRR